jgi:predicted helicase
MVRLSKDPNGNYRARKRIPRDVKAEYGLLYEKTSEEKFYRKAETKESVARREFNEWSAEIETRIANIRAQQKRKAGLAPKVMLRADKDSGTIRLDSETQLTGVPAEAWTYKLGNRSALEWILDQYKEKTPKDPTIRDKFNTYRFADHKEKVIDLLKRVTRVSIETMKIVESMQTEKH